MNATNRIAKGIGGAPLSLRIENDFYKQAASLRRQLEEHFSIWGRDHAGATQLTYVFSENRYQFLTAAAEHLFAAETLQDLIDTLSDWGQQEFGISHVSTPQVRIYFNGCAREVVQDNVMLGWHYKLCLTRTNRHQVGGRVRVTVTGNSECRSYFGVSEFVQSQLTFNQLLVHDTRSAYGVEAVKSSMNPLDGVVFLDGYLW